MKHSFKIFWILAALLVILVLLRLNSISYSGPDEDAEIIHLEDVHDQGNLFKIRYRDQQFILEPLATNIKVNPPIVRGNEMFLSPLSPGREDYTIFGKTKENRLFFATEEPPEKRFLPVGGEVEIVDKDVIAVGNRHFVFNVFPRSGGYREVLNRSLREIFKRGSREKYIGGWLETESQRDRLLTKQESRRRLLRDLLVEIDAEQLKPLISRPENYKGKLMTIRLNQEYQPPLLELTPHHIPVTLLRDRREREAQVSSVILLKDGDIIKIPYRDSRRFLEIKFNIKTIRAITYLSVSYKTKHLFYPNFLQSPRTAFLKSLHTGTTHTINKSKPNLFIGDKGLFTMNLDLKRFAGKLHIPDQIPEGGMADIKELLDRGMYYRKDGQYFPVTRGFLEQLQDILSNSSKYRLERCQDLHNYLEERRIVWQEFEEFSEEFGLESGNKNIFRSYRRFLKKAGVLARKMASKGIYRVFSNEIAKLNTGHQIRGIGISLPPQSVRRVTYQPPRRSWMRAGQVKENIPIVAGIQSYYWGSLIRGTDAPVHFRIRFTQTPPPFRLITVGRYTYSFEGPPKKSQDAQSRQFFDGPQEIRMPEGKRELYVKVWNIGSFNRGTGSTNFQAWVTFKGLPDREESPGGELQVTSDGTWESSVNGIDWVPAVVDPAGSSRSAETGAKGLHSLWYREKWNPLYSGIRFRYFKKRFQLPDRPVSVTWKIFVPGDYILRVNGKTVQQESDFTAALKRGWNTVTVIVSRQGYRKYFYINRMFRTKDGRIQLKQKPVRKVNFKKVKTERRPLISDMDNKVLAYSSGINGRSRRFYTPGVLPQLASIIGNPSKGVFGLEQVFEGLYRRDRIAGLRLTLRKEWQSIALEAMKNKLEDNKRKETENGEYKKLEKQLSELGTQLRAERRKLARTAAGERREVMREIIRLQNRMTETTSEIEKIKNHFYEASVVLMSARGEILVAASYPYDEQTMSALNPRIVPPYLPRENPYHNRCWKWKYNPGSTAKIMDSIAFLQSRDETDDKGNYRFPDLRDLLDPKKGYSGIPTVDLKGSHLLNGKYIGFQLRNFQGHQIPGGFCSLADALAHSYNTYFSYLALHNHRILTQDSLVYRGNEVKKGNVKFLLKADVPIERTYRDYPLLEMAERLMMNRPIDLLYHLGKTPLAAEYSRRPTDAFITVPSQFPVNAYTPADIAHYSIGQGDFQLTALQNAIIVSTVANGGILNHPSIIKSVTLNEPDGNEGNHQLLDINPEKDNVRIYNEKVAEEVKAAMAEVVKGGTSVGLFRSLREGRTFYAKTGTAETEVYPDNSLFAGFVTCRNGETLIFSVIVPRSGLGARVAGRLTEEIISAVIEYENKRGGNY